MRLLAEVESTGGSKSSEWGGSIGAVTLPRERRSLLLVALGASAALGLAALRMLLQPLQPYGDGAAQYIEHAVRLELLQELRAHEGGLLEALRLADDTILSHPPGLHLLTLLSGSFTGHEAEQVLWTGLAWLLILALSLAGVARGLGAGRRATLAAFLGGLLLPAAHAASTRYHYDLPMTALLWAAVAVLLLSLRSRPLLGGSLAGLLFAAAAVVKWTALPFGLPMLAAALFCGPPGSGAPPLRRRLLAAVGLVLLGGGALLGYLAVAPESFRAGQLVTEESPVGLFGLIWYPMGLVTAVLSPLGALALALPLRAWFRGQRTGWPLLAGTCAGQGAFLLFFVTRPDERFLLTLAPAIVLVAALGWDRIPAPRVRAAVPALLALVLLEFHLSPPSALNQQGWVITEREGMTALGHRGLFLADSFEGRGWSSAATTPDNRDALRDEVWEALQSCGRSEIAVEELVSDRGDVWWLRYRAALRQVRREQADEGILVLGPMRIASRQFWWPNPDTRRDAPLHYDSLGFSMDRVPEIIPEPDPGDPGDLRLLQDLGIEAAALSHFRPEVALSRLPPPESSSLHRGWRLVREFPDPLGQWRLGLFQRGSTHCTDQP